MKRVAAPKTWPILRRERTFIVRPKPKGQPLALTLPVSVVLRDILGLVKNASQANKVMKSQEILVNGRRVYTIADAVGFMDLLTVGKDNYRVLLDKNNILIVTPVKKGEEFTVQRISGKTSAGKTTQLHFASGANLLVAKDTYKVGDSVTFSDGKITAHYPLAQGAVVLIVGGSHIGKVGKITSVEGQVVTIQDNETTVQTRKAYAYVIGTGKPIITING